jgi:nucleolar protein 15
MLKRAKGKAPAEIAEEQIDLAEYSDSSDEDSSGSDGEVEAPPIDVGKLPTVAKDDVSVARKLAAAKKKQQTSVSRGPLIIESNLPAQGFGHRRYIPGANPSWFL